MAPRAYWTGTIRISLVTFGVRLYNAVSEADKIKLNQVHKGCNTRIKMPTTCPVHGVIDRSEVVKAYEFEENKYVVIEQAELDAIKIKSEKTIELTKFVPAASVPELYHDSTYFVGPNGPIAEEPFRVFRAAMEKAKAVGLGKFMVGGRERPVVFSPSGKGFTLTTLHAASEVKASSEYFEEVSDAAPPAQHLELATALIKASMGKFDPAEFRDRYQEALTELVKSKIAGQTPVIIQEEDAPPTFDFMAALQQSLKGSTPRKAAAATEPAAPPAAASAPAKRGAKKPPAASRPAAEKPAAKKRKQA